MERQVTKTFRIQTFKIKDLRGRYGFANRQDCNYDWNKLENSIKQFGYSPEKFNFIEYEDVRHDQGFKQDYMLVDGAHRLAVLEDLYGDDIEVRVKVEEIDTIDGKKFIRPDSNDKSCPYCLESLKGCQCKIAKSDDGFDVHSKCRIPYNKRMESKKKQIEEHMKMVEKRDNIKFQ